ncbi:hypothetical protein F1K67_24280 [Vibrio parahaemolyticus]|nr:hypothetical protein [Vibrio parahaemolyticus]
MPVHDLKSVNTVRNELFINVVAKPVCNYVYICIVNWSNKLCNLHLALLPSDKSKGLTRRLRRIHNAWQFWFELA